MAEFKIIKYPRTPHLEGSRLQPGDEDVLQVAFSEIAGKTLAVEEKCDGANSAISFDANGDLLLQSRGHYLTGGYRERHYNLLKQWASVHQQAFYNVLGSRYIMYGEWMYAKHSIFYDNLPHYFLEFDILDRETGAFLDTPSRHQMLAGLPVVSVPVIRRKTFQKKEELLNLIGHSVYITDNHFENLERYCNENGLDSYTICGETDRSTTMEGLYIKVEENGQVTDRLKFVRPSFLQTILESQTHWLDRPIVPNQLRFPLEEIYAPTLSVTKCEGQYDQ